MKLPQFAVYTILLLLFILSASIRADRSSQVETFYFKGESATHYRYAYMISQRGSPPRIDRKAAFPEGFNPARAQAMGVEYAAGYGYKVAHYFSTMNERTFIRLFTLLLFSLLVWIAYGLSSALWRCQAGALLSAVLTACSLPLIAATDGSTFTHLPFASVVIGLHLLLLVRYLPRPTTLTAAAASLTGLALAALWEGALIYLGLILILVLLGRTIDTPAKWKWLLPHIVLIAAALFLFAHLREGAEVAPWLSYAGSRLKFLFGKPADPALLPEQVRMLWTRAHTFPPTQTLLAIALPLLLLLPPLIAGLRSMPAQRRKFLPVAVIATAVAAVLFLIDRSFIVLAVPAFAIMWGPALFAFSKQVPLRIGFIMLALFLVFTQLALPGGGADLTGRIGRALGTTNGEEEAFTWVSIGDADLDLITYLTTRTAIRDPFLAGPEHSSLILTFAGRTTTLMPGITTPYMMEKSGMFLNALYRDEEELYRACSERAIAYVLYTIDMTLDDSRYSLRYQSGITDLPKESPVFKMHFFPEDLTRFELQYENDNYRLFKVVESARPIFISDHPPVYQYDILIRNRDSLASFADRIIQVISLYALATSEHAAQNWPAAVERYTQCLAQAPRFTTARLGLAAAFTAQKEWQLARAAFLSIINYAPDNREALFGAAFAMYHLAEYEEALRYLNILIGTPGDTELTKRARGLRMAVTEKLPEQD